MCAYPGLDKVSSVTSSCSEALGINVITLVLLQRCDGMFELFSFIEESRPCTTSGDISASLSQSPEELIRKEGERFKVVFPPTAGNEINCSLGLRL